VESAENRDPSETTVSEESGYLARRAATYKLRRASARVRDFIIDAELVRKYEKELCEMRLKETIERMQRSDDEREAEKLAEVLDKIHVAEKSQEKLGLEELSEIFSQCCLTESPKKCQAK
ncbi:unnamed protein product, partial [Gongylonema pulchrum]|uniref:EB1 C-terminal domain-containing protein n=1 Tax=Gongylonema pulchrum TaxID=637853 RepID=A0A183CXC6_9BILA